MNHVIDLTDKLKSKEFINEFKDRLARFEELIDSDPSVKEEVLLEMYKFSHRLDLLKLTVERGFDPKEFLIIPKTPEGV